MRGGTNKGNWKVPALVFLSAVQGFLKLDGTVETKIRKEWEREGSRNPENVQKREIKRAREGDRDTETVN